MEKPVEEMDAVEFRRYAKSLPKEEREQVRRERNALRRPNPFVSFQAAGSALAAGASTDPSRSILGSRAILRL